MKSSHIKNTLSPEGILVGAFGMDDSWCESPH